MKYNGSKIMSGYLSAVTNVMSGVVLTSCGRVLAVSCPLSTPPASLPTVSVVITHGDGRGFPLSDDEKGNPGQPEFRAQPGSYWAMRGSHDPGPALARVLTTPGPRQQGQRGSYSPCCIQDTCSGENGKRHQYRGTYSIESLVR